MNLTTILKTTQEVAKDVVGPNAEIVDREARWPEEGIRALQQAKLAGLVNGKDTGGLGFGLRALSQVCEIIGSECASTALCFGMHCVGSAVISAKATRYHREHYLVPINDCQHITTLALSEPGTGAHFYFPQCQLSKNSENIYQISGTKTFVTSGGYADSYVVSTTATDPEAPPDQFSCVVIPKEFKGLQWGEPWNGLGMRGNSSRTLELGGVHVQPDNLLGEEGDQLWYIFQVVAPYFLISMAGTYLGLASAAIQEAKTHMLKRSYTHSGTTLAKSSVLQHRLGCLWSEVERTRQLIYYAANSYDAGESDALPAILSAKAEVADSAVRVVNETMTLMGGIAYSTGSKMHRLLRDARAAHIMAPTTDMLRVWTGRVLLDQSILGDS